MNRTFALSSVVLATMFLSACDLPAEDTKNLQAEKAKEAANSLSFAAGNAEIDNIKHRLQLTADPGLIGYIVLFNDMGRPILYTTVKGKVTSGSKRLTPPVKTWEVFGGPNTLGTAPSDEGTFGDSNPYIYFWTTGGQYIQWSGTYLYSDKPLRTAEEPAVILLEQQVTPPKP